MKKISASLLASDPAHLASELKAISKSGADFLHLDIMDGHFVDSLSFGPSILSSIRKYCSLPVDVHLMVSEPQKWLSSIFEKGGENLRSISFHLEVAGGVTKILQSIRQSGIKVGLAIKPSTPADRLFSFLPKLDIVLVMTVEPGFGGQSFLHNQVQKLDYVKKRIQSLGEQKEVQVDGGVSEKNIHFLKSADVLVSCSFIFQNKGRYGEAVWSLKNKLYGKA